MATYSYRIVMYTELWYTSMEILTVLKPGKLKVNNDIIEPNRYQLASSYYQTLQKVIWRLSDNNQKVNKYRRILIEV